MKTNRRLTQNFVAGLLILISSLTVSGADKIAAPDFTLKSLSGENVRLSDLKGQVVLLNFWASWCGPCRQEMPILNEIHKKYQALGFTVIGLNVDKKSEKAVEYLKGVNVDFPVLLDPESKVSELYSVSAMPSTAFIDRDGNVRFVHAGYKTGDEDKYAKMIKELMRD